MSDSPFEYTKPTTSPASYTGEKEYDKSSSSKYYSKKSNMYESEGYIEGKEQEQKQFTVDTYKKLKDDNLNYLEKKYEEMRNNRAIESEKIRLIQDSESRSRKRDGLYTNYDIPMREVQNLINKIKRETINYENLTTGKVKYLFDENKEIESYLKTAIQNELRDYRDRRDAREAEKAAKGPTKYVEFIDKDGKTKLMTEGSYQQAVSQGKVKEVTKVQTFTSKDKSGSGAGTITTIDMPNYGPAAVEKIIEQRIASGEISKAEGDKLIREAWTSAMALEFASPSYQSDKASSFTKSRIEEQAQAWTLAGKITYDDLDKELGKEYVQESAFVSKYGGYFEDIPLSKEVSLTVDYSPGATPRFDSSLGRAATYANSYIGGGSQIFSLTREGFITINPNANAEQLSIAEKEYGLSRAAIKEYNTNLMKHLKDIESAKDKTYSETYTEKDKPSGRAWVSQDEIIHFKDDEGLFIPTYQRDKEANAQYDIFKFKVDGKDLFFPLTEGYSKVDDSTIKFKSDTGQETYFTIQGDKFIPSYTFIDGKKREYYYEPRVQDYRIKGPLEGGLIPVNPDLIPEVEDKSGMYYLGPENILWKEVKDEEDNINIIPLMRTDFTEFTNIKNIQNSFKNISTFPIASSNIFKTFQKLPTSYKETSYYTVGPQGYEILPKGFERRKGLYGEQELFGDNIFYKEEKGQIIPYYKVTDDFFKSDDSGLYLQLGKEEYAKEYTSLGEGVKAVQLAAKGETYSPTQYYFESEIKYETGIGDKIIKNIEDFIGVVDEGKTSADYSKDAIKYNWEVASGFDSNKEGELSHEIRQSYYRLAKYTGIYEDQQNEAAKYYAGYFKFAKDFSYKLTKQILTGKGGALENPIMFTAFPVFMTTGAISLLSAFGEGVVETGIRAPGVIAGGLTRTILYSEGAFQNIAWSSVKRRDENKQKTDIPVGRVDKALYGIYGTAASVWEPSLYLFVGTFTSKAARTSVSFKTVDIIADTGKVVGVSKTTLSQTLSGIGKSFTLGNLKSGIMKSIGLGVIGYAGYKEYQETGDIGRIPLGATKMIGHFVGYNIPSMTLAYSYKLSGMESKAIETGTKKELRNFLIKEDRRKTLELERALARNNLGNYGSKLDAKGNIIYIKSPYQSQPYALEKVYNFNKELASNINIKIFGGKKPSPVEIQVGQMMYGESYIKPSWYLSPLSKSQKVYNFLNPVNPYAKSGYTYWNIKLFGSKSEKTFLSNYEKLQSTFFKSQLESSLYKDVLPKVYQPDVNIWAFKSSSVKPSIKPSPPTGKIDKLIYEMSGYTLSSKTPSQKISISNIEFDKVISSLSTKKERVITIQDQQLMEYMFHLANPIKRRFDPESILLKNKPKKYYDMTDAFIKSLISSESKDYTVKILPSKTVSFDNLFTPLKRFDMYTGFDQRNKFIFSKSELEYQNVFYDVMKSYGKLNKQEVKTSMLKEKQLIKLTSVSGQDSLLHKVFPLTKESSQMSITYYQGIEGISRYTLNLESTIKQKELIKEDLFSLSNIETKLVEKDLFKYETLIGDVILEKENLKLLRLEGIGGLEKQSLLEKQGLIEKESILERQALIEKQALIQKQSLLEKQALLEKQTWLEKQSLLEKQTWLERQSVLEKQSLLEKQLQLEKVSILEKFRFDLFDLEYYDNLDKEKKNKRYDYTKYAPSLMISLFGNAEKQPRVPKAAPLYQTSINPRRRPSFAIVRLGKTPKIERSGIRKADKTVFYNTKLEEKKEKLQRKVVDQLLGEAAPRRKPGRRKKKGIEEPRYF